MRRFSTENANRWKVNFPLNKDLEHCFQSIWIVLIPLPCCVDEVNIVVWPENNLEPYSMNTEEKISNRSVGGTIDLSEQDNVVGFPQGKRTIMVMRNCSWWWPNLVVEGSNPNLMMNTILTIHLNSSLLMYMHVWWSRLSCTCWK